MNQLIDKCLYNWLGYGNLDGDIWFIGTEEGGAEVWREGIATISLKESLKKRSKFSLACDFRTVWKDIYGIPLDSFKGITTWHFMSALILASEDKKVDSNSIKEFLFINKKLGSINGNHFLCELLPLPKKSENEFPYVMRWKSQKEYIQEVIDRRFSMIAEAIKKSRGAKLVVVYDDKTQRLIMNKWGDSIQRSEVFEYVNDSKKPQRYIIYFNCIEGKNVMFLFTPFFGQGQISYGGIEEALEILREKFTYR
jgi:hypothetical protein